MGAIVGIDLGTTFSAVAYIRDGVPQILTYGDERIMPSVIGLSPDGTLLVGTPARNQYILYPERTIRSIKRKMGQDIRVPLGDKDYSPQEISAMILRELKRRAEIALNTPVDRAVITVPAYFSDAARQATREAGEIAGFIVERIINEPTAAALAYGLDRQDERQLVAVYDLGGGTFDVSIIELDSGIVEVRASHGNTQLGGDDFDQALMDFLATRFQDEHGVDPRQDRRATARLLRTAEEAKIRLSSQPFTRVREEYLMSADRRPLHLDGEIARAEFEGLIADLLDGTLESVDAGLRDAGMTAADLSRVLFVGGSTRIPRVWELVNERTGLEPEIAINPDEAVARGAAVQAAIIAGEPLDAILVDVTPHSLGIAVAEFYLGRLIPDRYSVIIHRNTTIPTTRSEVYSAIHPDQAGIELKVYQGEEPVASENTLLGEFLFDHLRPETPGQPPRITVKFDFDVDGILHVSAVDRGSGKEASMTVHAARTRLTPAEIHSAHEGLEALGWADTEAEEEILEGDVVAAATQLAALPPASPEMLALLARAHRVLEHDTRHAADLEGTIGDLESSIRRGDLHQAEEYSDRLLNLLYDLDADV